LLQKLGFIDDQHRLQVLAMPLDQEVIEIQQQLRFALAGRKTQVSGNVLQHLERRQFGIKDVSRSQVILVQDLQQAADDERLPGTNFACQHHESAVPANAVIQRGKRLAMRVRGKQEFGIGADLERVARQSKMVLVHSLAPVKGDQKGQNDHRQSRGRDEILLARSLSV